MSNKSTHNEADSNDHSDCQDCRRQKKQNQALIGIYQRLQNINQKVGTTHKSIQLHRQFSEDNSIKAINLNQKVQNIKKIKSSSEQQQFQNVGYQLYAQMIENMQKNKHLKENQRLRKVLRQIYQQKQPVSSDQNIHSFISQKLQDKFDIKACTNNSFSQRQPETSSGKLTQIFSTKTSFNTTKRRSFNFKQFNQLDLWLLQNDNKKLEKQLYEEPIFKKNNSHPNETIFKTNSSKQRMSRMKLSSIFAKNNSFRSDYLHQKRHHSPKFPQLNKQKPIVNEQKLVLNEQNLDKQLQKIKAQNYFSKRVKGNTNSIFENVSANLKSNVRSSLQSNMRGSVLPAINTFLK